MVSSGWPEPRDFAASPENGWGGTWGLGTHRTGETVTGWIVSPKATLQHSRRDLWTRAYL